MDKKIAPSSFELYQENQAKKAKIHFYSIIILNVFFALVSVFSPGNFTTGIITTFVAAILSLGLLFGIKYTNVLWCILCGVQLFYYFFNLSTYLDKSYPLTWFVIICLRSAFCFYCLWAFIINYDIQDIIRQKIKK